MTTLSSRSTNSFATRCCGCCYCLFALLCSGNLSPGVLTGRELHLQWRKEGIAGFGAPAMTTCSSPPYTGYGGMCRP